MSAIVQLPTFVNPEALTTLAEARAEVARMQTEMMAMGEHLAMSNQCATTQWQTIQFLLKSWEENDQAAIMKQLARLHAYVNRAPAQQH
jgi:hypothetical protein